LRADGNGQNTKGARNLVDFGVAVPDVASKVEELKQTGAVVLNPPPEVPGWYKMALLRDPWGVRFELIEDAGPPDIRYVRLGVPDPDETLRWLEKMFGGERGRLRNKVDGLRYGNVWVLVESIQETDPAERPESGGRMDHLGWRPENVDVKISELREKGATILSEPRDYGPLRFAFVEAPPGLRIELTQRPVQSDR